MDWIPPIYIMCNRTHEPNRYAILVEHLPKKGIPMEKVRWIEGPWGSELTSEDYFKHYDPFEKRLGFPIACCFKSAMLLRGEVSLVLTFKKLVEEAVAAGHDTILVFESDVVLRDDFMIRLRSVLEEGANRNWDYISLGEGVGTRPSEHRLSYFSPTKLYKPATQWVFRCTDSMLFRRKFLQKLAVTLNRFRECLDWELNVQIIAHGGIALWADPPLVEPGSGRWRLDSLLPG